MSLFKDSNTDIEGVTTTNACYGGTQALFNALDWVQSDFYDGRLAIVICADIAVYAKGNARPTGGCGAIAMLIGPDAPIAFDLVRSTYMNNVYDFYKPDPSKEYPTVDGAFSIDCYFKALESCYRGFMDKWNRAYSATMGPFKGTEQFDFACFHSPFSKMVDKAFTNLVSYDIKYGYSAVKTDSSRQIADEYKDASKYKLDASRLAQFRREIDALVKQKLEPGLFLSRQLGNIYVGSLYCGLISLIIDSRVDLSGKRILMFSYGSGCAASMFSLQIRGPIKDIQLRNQDVLPDLEKRIILDPKTMEDIMTSKEKLYISNGYTPLSPVEDIRQGTYYLVSVDDKWRRYYAKKEVDSKEKTLKFNKLANTSLRRFGLLAKQLSGN